MTTRLPAILSFNGGYVDTAGFLAFQGLFTAHVTGNFVTLGAAVALGSTGAIAKLLALPTFCVVVIVTRLMSFGLLKLKLPVLRTMLVVKFILLCGGAIAVIGLGPFPDSDSLLAVLSGLVFVGAMAIQNALHRIHLGNAPPTTLMTGATTQMMIDVADLVLGRKQDERDPIIARFRKLAASVGSFALGCAASALLFLGIGKWCFVVPPLIAGAAFFASLDEVESEGK